MGFTATGGSVSVDDSSIEFDSSQQISIKDGGVTADMLTSGLNDYEVISDTTLTGTGALTTGTISTTGFSVLKVIVFAKTDTGANTDYMRFNGDSGNNYNITYLNGTGGAVTCTTTAALGQLYMSQVSNVVWSVYTVDIVNDGTNATHCKSTGGTGTSHYFSCAGNWSSTKITSVSLNTPGNNFLAGSRIIVLGIRD